MKMPFLGSLVSRMSALFSSEYRTLRDKAQYFDSNKKEILKNHKRLEKEMLAELEKRLILKERIRVLSDIYINLKHGAPIVSLSEFYSVVQELSFYRNLLVQTEALIKDNLEQLDLYSKELLEQAEEIKTLSKALEKFGVLIKI